MINRIWSVIAFLPSLTAIYLLANNSNWFLATGLATFTFAIVVMIAFQTLKERFKRRYSLTR